MIKQEKRTVAHVYGGSPKKRGSLEEYFLELTKHLSEIGWRSIFYFNQLPTGELAQAYEDAGAEIRILRTASSRFDLSFIYELRKQFDEISPAVVNVHFGHTGINGLIAAVLSGVNKRIWTKHSLDPVSYREELPWVKKWLHTINYQALWATDIVAVSQAVRNELADHSIVKKVHQFYLGINLQRFAAGRFSMEKKKALGIPENRRVVVCVSQARPEKGIEYLVRAIGLIRNDPSCPYVIIIGGGPLTTELEKLANELEISALIHFCGVRNDVEDILAISSFTVLPSLEEAAGLAVLESMAAGKAVVASCVGGIPEFIENDVNGIMVYPRDIAGLAAAISKLCQDENLLNKLSMGAKDRSREYDVKLGVANTIAVYGVEEN